MQKQMNKVSANSTKYLLAILLLFSTYCSFSQVVIPFELTNYNNIAIKAVINQKDTVKLMFHTAANSLTLTEAATKKMKHLVFDRTDSVKSWGGSGNTSRFSKSNSLAMATLKWENIPLWENANSGPQTDGKFGLELFANQVIEIDFDHQVLILHEQLPKKVNSYQKLNLKVKDELMFVEGALKVSNTLLANQFLLHTGYSGTILFDDEFTAKHHLANQLKIVDQKVLKDSFGNKLITQKAIAKSFHIKKMVLKDIPVNFFTGAIGRQKMSVLGGDFIKRFNVIIDANRTCIYLKSNTHNQDRYWNG